MEAVNAQTISVTPPPPVEECFTEIDGARMRYLRCGSGPPLLLLHGLLGYSFSWRFNIATLARHRTVYAIDQIGTGFSSRANLDFSMPAIADRTLRFAEQVGISSSSTAFDLAGASHGGAIAALLAARVLQRMTERRYPRINHLILVSPANPWSAYGQSLAPLLSTWPISAVGRWVLPRARFAYRQRLRRFYGDPRRIQPGTLEGYKAALLIPGTFDYALAILSNWRQDMRLLERTIPSLAQISTLLVWGTRDTVVSPASARTFQRYLPDAQLVMIEGAGHIPNEECPEEFNRAMIAFLQR